MSHYEAPIREPLILGDKSYSDISNDIAAPVEGKANKWWWFSIYYFTSRIFMGCWCNCLYHRYRYRGMGIEQQN